jgi:hypothetical protein
MNSFAFIATGIVRKKGEDELYEVMFDEPFPYGLTDNLYGGDRRGYRLRKESLINITWGMKRKGEF